MPKKTKVSEPGGGGGTGKALPIENFKVSKIMLWPSRKINLGNYSTVDLNAGIEIVFDNPVLSDSQELKDAYEKARKIVREELNEQYKPFRKPSTK